jgi:hypothetical protein
LSARSPAAASRPMGRSRSSPGCRGEPGRWDGRFAPSPRREPQRCRGSVLSAPEVAWPAIFEPGKRVCSALRVSPQKAGSWTWRASGWDETDDVPLRVGPAVARGSRPSEQHKISRVQAVICATHRSKTRLDGAGEAIEVRVQKEMPLQLALPQGLEGHDIELLLMEKGIALERNVPADEHAKAREDRSLFLL